MRTVASYAANVTMVLGLIVTALGVFAGPDWLIGLGVVLCFAAAGLFLWVEWTEPEYDEEEES